MADEDLELQMALALSLAEVRRVGDAIPAAMLIPRLLSGPAAPC